MRQRSKSLVALLLLLCFTAPIGLTYAVLKWKQWQVKENIEQQILIGMDKGELLELTFSIEDSKKLDWEHEREFVFEKQSYDVVESKIEGDSITYFVWWDKVETKIKHQMAELVSLAMNHDQQNQENQNRIENFFKTLYPSGLVLFQPETTEIVSINIDFIALNYCSPDWAPPVPPPLFI